MYIAVNMRVARVDLMRAIRFAIRKETLIDMIKALSIRTDFEDFQVYYVS